MQLSILAPHLLNEGPNVGQLVLHVVATVQVGEQRFKIGQTELAFALLVEPWEQTLNACL